MKKRAGPRIKRDPPRGILGVRPAEAASGVTRYWPSEALAPFVEHYWTVRWDLDAPRLAETVPHPSVHLVLETQGPPEVVGVMRRRFSRELAGRGRVVGTKFRPGAFRAFVDGPVSALTDRRVPVEDLFGASGRRSCDRAIGREEDAETIAALESMLLARRPAASASMALAGHVAARAASDRGITRVDQLATAAAVAVRTLQRLFGEYVGVSPKWVIQRYRLLEAVARMAENAAVKQADLAAELGYADQAHFIRAFKTLVGRTPVEYARGLAAAPPWR